MMSDINTSIGWNAADWHDKFIGYFVKAATSVGFPDVKDRSDNQPTVIIQPAVVQAMMEKLKNISKDIARNDNVEQKTLDLWDTEIKSYLGPRRSDNLEENNTRMFCYVAKRSGWRVATMTGKQVILSCGLLSAVIPNLW